MREMISKAEQEAVSYRQGLTSWDTHWPLWVLWAMPCAPPFSLLWNWGGAGYRFLRLPPSHHALQVASVVSDSLRPPTCSLPGSSVHGILQVRVLEWVTIPILQGIFPRSPKLQGLNPSLPNCRWILYHLSHQEALSISYQSGKLKIMYGKELKREKLKK